jgi:DeoR/GlpR family transcriptional regulator of sugar metabolism
MTRMKGTNMLPAERLKAVLADIISRGSGSISELSEKYNVSEMTIRRDLTTLEEQGYIQRTHGGAVNVGTSPIEPLHEMKKGKNVPQKESIARLAAERFIQDGDVIIVEGGTTIAAMLPHLSRFHSLTIVTNSLYTVNTLKQHATDHTIIMSGGMLRGVSFTLVGPLAERTFQDFNANKVFLSAVGWTAEVGYSDPGMLDSQVKKAMIQAAAQIIMLLDSSKFGVTSLTTFLGPFEANVLITDKGAPAESLSQIQDHGTLVLCAD